MHNEKDLDNLAIERLEKMISDVEEKTTDNKKTTVTPLKSRYENMPNDNIYAGYTILSNNNK